MQYTFPADIAHLQEVRFNWSRLHKLVFNVLNLLLLFLLYSMSEFVGTGKNVMEEKISAVFL